MTSARARHPYRVLWEERDPDQGVQALSPNVVLHSPLIETPFVGRAVAIDLFASLLAAFDEVTITGEFAGDGEHVFRWVATTQDGQIEGVDIIRHDVGGDVAEVTVFVRPLTGLGTFSAVLGPSFARRRGVIRGVAAKLIGAPLRPLLKMVDFAAARLVRTR